MNKNIQELVQLSSIDKKIDSFQPQIDAAQMKITKSNAKLQEARGRLEKIKGLIASNEQKIVTYEEQLRFLGEQLKNSVKKGRDISSEKEMKALAIEEDIAKEKMTFANEEIARLQEINAKKLIESQEEQGGFDLLESECSSIAADVENEKSQIETNKIGLFSDREKTIREVDQKVLAFYEKIRNWAGNSAVALVKKQACYGCYMKLNDKTYADVIRAEEITTCPHCGRILYVERESAGI